MAGKRDQWQGNNNLEFASFSWNKEIEADYERWIKENAPDFAEGAAYLVNAGYSIKFSPPDDNGSYKVSATGISPSNPNKDMCITSWGNDSEDALLITVYKVDVIYQGHRAEASRSQKGGRR